MKLGTFVFISFLASFALLTAGVLLKILHAPNANLILAIAVITSFVFSIAAIYEVWTSKALNHSEKTMWIVAFTFLGSYAGLIYILFGRRRVSRQIHSGT